MGSRTARMLALGALALGALGFAAPAAAQDDYPNKTVTLVVPYPPGGGVDVLARVVAEKLSGVLGHQVIVDNRVGGSGLVGTRALIRSAPDGYTLFLGHTGSISINPSLTPIPDSIRARTSPRSACSPRCRSRCSRIRASRPRPSARWSSSRRRGRQDEHRHVGGRHRRLSLRRVVQVDHRRAGDHRAYKGTAQLMNDLLGGHVPIAFGVLPPAMGNLAAGTLRGIAILDKQRFSLLPNIPTSHESGLPGFESVLHYGLLAPTGSAAPNREQAQRRNAPGRQHRRGEEAHQQRGGDPLTSTPKNMPPTSTRKRASGAR
jgi:hypothetical protein